MKGPTDDMKEGVARSMAIKVPLSQYVSVEQSCYLASHSRTIAFQSINSADEYSAVILLQHISIIVSVRCIWRPVARYDQSTALIPIILPSTKSSNWLKSATVFCFIQCNLRSRKVWTSANSCET